MFCQASACNVFKMKITQVVFQFIRKKPQKKNIVLVANDEEALFFDQKLWSVYADGFLPHVIKGDEYEELTSNIIAHELTGIDSADNIIIPCENIINFTKSIKALKDAKVDKSKCSVIFVFDGSKFVNSISECVNEIKSSVSNKVKIVSNEGGNWSESLL